MKVTIHPLSTGGAAPRGIPADEALIGRLQESFRPIAERGTELADRFYARLFAEHPEIRPLFPANMADQKRKLLDTLSLIIESLREPEITRRRIEQLGVAHVGYGAKTEHYALVHNALVLAMADTAGASWTKDLHAEWSGAINLVATAMIIAAKGAPKAS